MRSNKKKFKPGHIKICEKDVEEKKKRNYEVNVHTICRIITQCLRTSTKKFDKKKRYEVKPMID